MGVLADVRATVALALEPGPGDDWNVQAGPVDAVEAPAFMLVWSEPWLTPATHCQQFARLDVIAVSARVDIEGGGDLLEALVELAFATLTPPPVAVSRPAPFDVGGVTYLAARITLSVPVTLGGSDA